MKRKVVYSLILGIVFVVMLITLFFSESLEEFLKFKPKLNKIDDSSFEMHFIDVGQGDAIAIRFPNDKTLLVDSGPVAGRDNLEEYLDNVFFKDSEKIFNYVFLTHSDIDHSGNMKFILENYKVEEFYRPKIFSQNLEDEKAGFKVDNSVYDEVIEEIAEQQITTYFPTDNATIDVGEDSFIHMFTSLDESIDETNEFSPILIISANSVSACLSGDAGEDIEKELAERGCLKNVDLLKLAHHGSKYSNSIEFIEFLNPEYVVCSVGENSYGHPASEVLLRLANYDEEYDKTTFDTFKATNKDGNIIYFVNDTTIEILTINSLGDYLFLDWYIVVIVTNLLVLVVVLFIVIPKKPIKINRHLKNMKK